MRDGIDRSGPALVFLIVVSFVMMTLDIRASGEGMAGTLRGGSQALLAPVQEAAGAVITPIVDVMDGLANLGGLRSENERLRRENEELRAEIAQFDDLQQRFESLQRILRVQDVLGDQLTTTPAQVVSASDSFDLSFTIDKGTNDGILTDNPVLDEFGFLLGRVTAVNDSTAQVVLIVDQQEAVEVLTPDGEIGIVFGGGDEQSMEFRVIQAVGPVEAGEVLVTSTSSNFPPGLPVAEVSRSAIPEAGNIATTAVPLAQVTRPRAVVVIQWPPPVVPEPERPAVEEEVTPTTSDGVVTDTTEAG